MDWLNNREQAMLIWATVFTVFVIWQPKIRRNVTSVIRPLFQPRIVAVLGWLLIYVGLDIALLYHFDLWDVGQFKTTLVWLLFSAATSLFRVTLNTGDKEPQLFHIWLTDTFKIVVVVEFIASFHSLPLLAELVLIPVVAIVSAMLAIAESESAHKIVARLLGALLATIGGLLVAYVVFRIASDMAGFLVTNTIDDFFTPPLLSLTLIPFLFLLHAFVSYENTYTRLRLVMDDDRLRHYAMRRAIVSFHTDYEALWRWSRNVATQRPDSRKTVRNSINDVKRARLREKNPPSVSRKDGWSPYLARQFLSDVGLTTRDYHPSSDEWFAASDYVELSKDLLPNRIAYYVEGDEHAAKRLKLVLHVNRPSDADDAERAYFAIARTLIKSAVNGAISETAIKIVLAGTDQHVTQQGTSMRLTRDDFVGGIDGGYSLSLFVEQSDE